MSVVVEPICLIVNAASGKGESRAATDRAVAVLAAGGVPVQVVVASSGAELGELARTALRGGCRTVVAAGGDGTVSAVAAALVGTEAALGVLPLGTFNYFARGLGLPLDPEQAARVWLAGQVRAVEVGEVNGSVFLNSASVGLYVAVLAVRRTVYRRFGRSRLAGVWAVLLTLLRRRAPMQLRITAGSDTVAVSTPLLFATRSPYQLDSFGLAGRERVARGELALFVPLATGQLALLQLAVRLALRSLRPGIDIRVLLSREVCVEMGRQTVRLALDGERFTMRAPLRFLVRPAALRVLAPPCATAEAHANDPAPV